MIPPAIHIGTRGSPLALAQCGMIRDQLAALWPTHRFELKIIKTTGDSLQESPAKPLESTKAIFTKEIEEALLESRIDLAVHSAKDLASVMPEGLCLGAIPLRASPRDVLVLKPGMTPQDASQGAVLTGSARRRCQWVDLHPHATIEPVRGNIDTRLEKLLKHPTATGLLLAEAGLQRLQPELHSCTLHPLEPGVFLPAPGQGTLALQCRSGDAGTLKLLKALNHPPSALTLRAERAFLTAMEAGCSVPLGAYAWEENSLLHLDAVFYPVESRTAQRHRASGSPSNPEAVGLSLSRHFKQL